MRPAVLCALCAASSVSARAVWGDYSSSSGRVEKTEYTDTTHSITDTTTHTDIVTTTTDTTSSTITTDDLELVVKEIETIVDDVETTVDEIDAFFTINIELSACITVPVDTIEEVLGSTSTVPSATNNDLEMAVTGDLGAAADGTYAVVGDVTISAEGAGAATSDSGLEVSAGEGAGIIRVDNLEIALADPLDASIFELASTTSPTIIDGGTDLGIISEIPPNPTATTGGGEEANGTAIVGGSGGTRASGTTTVSGPTGSSSSGGIGTGGTSGAGTRGSVSDARGTKTGGPGTGGGATTLITITRTSSVFFPTVTTAGPRRFFEGGILAETLPIGRYSIVA